MRRYEVTFESVNTEHYVKPITALVVEPPQIGPRSGAMLFTHGWGGNRFAYEAMMHFVAQECDLVGISVEFRQSGYDFDPITGIGWDVPYDASFYQVFDVLNGLRTVLTLRPAINRHRLFHYGGSQGGHIALLSAILAPQTFAFVYAACAVTHIDERRMRSTAREFAPHELIVRDVIALANHIRCPVYMEHGTADEIVPHETHAVPLERRLRGAGTLAGVRYHEGGGHSLAPVTTRLDTFKAVAPHFLTRLTNEATDDFLAGRTVEIPCGSKKLVIEWSRPTGDVGLFRWEETGE